MFSQEQSFQVQIMKVHPDAVVPMYQTSGAAGFDFHAIEDVLIPPNETLLVRTGLAFAIPEGFELQVRPRSGLSLKSPLRVANSPGTVDSDYRGELGVILTNTYKEPYRVSKGDRIAQGVISSYVKADFVAVAELTNTPRGKGGFGSTGK